MVGSTTLLQVRGEVKKSRELIDEFSFWRDSSNAIGSYVREMQINVRGIEVGWSTQG